MKRADEYFCSIISIADAEAGGQTSSMLLLTISKAQSSSSSVKRAEKEISTFNPLRSNFKNAGAIPTVMSLSLPFSAKTAFLRCIIFSSSSFVFLSLVFVILMDPPPPLVFPPPLSRPGEKMLQKWWLGKVARKQIPPTYLVRSSCRSFLTLRWNLL